MVKQYDPKKGREDLEAHVSEVFRLLSGNKIDMLKLLTEEVNSVDEVAERIGLASSSVERTYNRLNHRGYIEGYSGEGDFDGEISVKGRDAIWISENITPAKTDALGSENSEILKIVNVSDSQVVFEGGSFYELGSGEEFVEGDYAVVRPTGEKNLGLNVVEVEEYPLDAEDYLD